VLLGLQQPGDDVLTEIPKKETDPQRSEALAQYMNAIAAEKDGDYTAALNAYQLASNTDPESPEPVRAHALLLMRLGRIAEATGVARRAIELDPDDAETRFRLAVLLLSQRKAPEAADLLDQAVESKRLQSNSPEFIRLHSVRGRLAIEMGRIAQAADSYSVLLNALERPEDFGLDYREHNALMTDRATGYQTIGEVMLKLGRIDEAITAFSAQVRISNNQPGDYHFQLALAQYRKDQLEAAEQNLNTYFTTGKRQKESLELLRDLYGATSRTDALIDRLNQLATDTTEASTVRLFLGEFQLDQGDPDAATATFQQVIDKSGDADAYLGLVRVDILRQDAPALIATLQKSIRARIQLPELIPLQREIVNNRDFATAVVTECLSELESKENTLSAEVVLYCSMIAQELELTEQEGQLLQATLDLNPAPAIGVRVLEQLGVNQLTQNKYDEAAASLRGLLSVSGLREERRVMALYRLSFAESFRDNHSEAVAAVKAALQISPNNAELTYQLAWVQVQAEQYEDAKQSLQEAISLARNEPQTGTRARLLLGGLYSQMEEWDQSIRVYQELIDDAGVTPDNVRRAKLALSNAHVQKGDISAGEKVLEDVYAASPDDPGVNNDLGYLYADQGKNLEQAEKMIRVAVEAEPENAAYLDSLGWVLFRLGRFEEALTALEKANADPDYRDSTIIEHMGDVLQALTRKEEAVKSWQEALKTEQESTKPDGEVIDRITKKLTDAGSAPTPDEPAP
jgi:tetratricopeptide (TPR) repeat protein